MSANRFILVSQDKFHRIHFSAKEGFDEIVSDLNTFSYTLQFNRRNLDDADRFTLLERVTKRVPTLVPYRGRGGKR